MKLKWILDLNLRAKTIKLLEEKYMIHFLFVISLFLMESFTHKVFIFVEILLFSSIGCAFIVVSKNYLPNPDSHENVSYIFLLEVL